MQKIVYLPPDGGFIDEPSEEMLRNVIINPKESYWLAGSADGGLHTDGPSGPSSLVLMYRKHLGFMVHLEEGNAISLVLCGDSDAHEKVELQHGGNTLRVPKSHFVKPQEALRAALEFRLSGQRPQSGMWIEFSPDEPRSAVDPQV